MEGKNQEQIPTPKDYRELRSLDGMTRNDVVPYYMGLILDDWTSEGTAKIINKKIIDKWSISALEYIKTKAWKYCDQLK